MYELKKIGKVFTSKFVGPGATSYKKEFTAVSYRLRNTALYDIPPIRSEFQVTHTNPRSSLMMSDHCRNM
jgi:hypothetical protein